MKTIPQQVSVDHDSERYVREWLCAQAAGASSATTPTALGPRSVALRRPPSTSSTRHGRDVRPRRQRVPETALCAAHRIAVR